MGNRDGPEGTYGGGGCKGGWAVLTPVPHLGLKTILRFQDRYPPGVLSTALRGEIPGKRAEMGCLCQPSSPQSHCVESRCDPTFRALTLRAARLVEARQALRPGGRFRGERSWPGRGHRPGQLRGWRRCRSLYITEPAPTGNHSPTPTSALSHEGAGMGALAQAGGPQRRSRAGQGELEGTKRAGSRVSPPWHTQGATGGPGLRTRRRHTAHRQSGCAAHVDRHGWAAHRPGLSLSRREQEERAPGSLPGRGPRRSTREQGLGPAERSTELL